MTNGGYYGRSPETGRPWQSPGTSFSGADPYSGGPPVSTGYVATAPAAPGFSPTPRPEPEVDELATLSVVVAFVFAPAGVVIGHLALRRIKRTGEPGRKRALIGTTLSYVITVIALLSLLFWLLWPVGSPKQTHSAVPADVLLTIPELDQLLQSSFKDNPTASHSGGPEIVRPLTDEFEGGENPCGGAVAVGAGSTYAGGTVDSAATRSAIYKDGEHRYAGVSQVAVAMASPADAQRVLEQATRQWQQCQGSSVTWKVPAGSKLSLVDTVSNVQVVDGILTATIQNGSAKSTVYTPTARALAVKGNLVIEASVSSYDLADTKSNIAVTDPDVSGVQVVKAIMDKVG